MKLNRQLLQINRNIIICSAISISLSAIVAQIFEEQENYIITIIAISTGYVAYFGSFSVLFYFDNKNRYKSMKLNNIKKELIALISSLGVGEIIYLGIRVPSIYYFLEIGIEPYLASSISEIISTGCYMTSVTLFLRKTKTY